MRYQSCVLIFWPQKLRLASLFVLQGSGKTRSQKTETQIGNMQFLHVYITHIRLSKTVERNLLMAESMRSNLPSVLQNSIEEVTAEPGSAGRKLSKPEDLVRIYDTILQVISFPTCDNA